MSLLDAIRKGLGLERREDMEVGEELVETKASAGWPKITS